MATSEAQKRAANKYIAKNMTVLGCKVRREYAEAVHAKAKAEGTTANAIIRQALDRFLES